MGAVGGRVGCAARTARVAGHVVAVHLVALHSVAGGEGVGWNGVSPEKGEQRKRSKHGYGCRVVAVPQSDFVDDIGLTTQENAFLGRSR